MTDFLSNVVRRGSGLPLPLLKPAPPRAWPWDADPFPQAEEGRAVSPSPIEPPTRPARHQLAPVPSPMPVDARTSTDRAGDTEDRDRAPQNLAAVALAEPADSDTALEARDHDCSCDEPPADRAPSAREPPASWRDPTDLEARLPTELYRPVTAAGDHSPPVEVNIGTIEIQLTTPALSAAPAPSRPRRPAAVGFDGYRALRTYRRRA